MSNPATESFFAKSAACLLVAAVVVAVAGVGWPIFVPVIGMICGGRIFIDHLKGPGS